MEEWGTLGIRSRTILGLESRSGTPSRLVHGQGESRPSFVFIVGMHINISAGETLGFTHYLWPIVEWGRATLGHVGVKSQRRVAFLVWFCNKAQYVVCHAWGALIQNSLGLHIEIDLGETYSWFYRERAHWELISTAEGNIRKKQMTNRQKRNLWDNLIWQEDHVRQDWHDKMQISKDLSQNREISSLEPWFSLDQDCHMSVIPIHKLLK